MHIALASSLDMGLPLDYVRRILRYRNRLQILTAGWVPDLRQLTGGQNSIRMNKFF